MTRFQVAFPSFASDFFNLLFVRFHLAETLPRKRKPCRITLPHFIQGRYDETLMEVDPTILQSWQSYRRRFSEPLAYATLLKNI